MALLEFEGGEHIKRRDFADKLKNLTDKKTIITLEKSIFKQSDEITLVLFKKRFANFMKSLISTPHK